MAEQNRNWGGSRQGSGRKAEGRHQVGIMLNKEEQAMLRKLGGSPWIREQIEKGYKRLEKKRKEQQGAQPSG